MFGLFRRRATATHASQALQRTFLRVESMEDRAVPSAGALDAGFGSSGQVTLYNHVDAFSGGIIDRSAHVQPDGTSIVVGSVVSFDSGVQFGVERYLANGMLDTAFGANGRAVIPFAGGVSRAHAAEVLPDGRIMVVGSVNSAYSSPASNKDKFAIVMLKSNGSVDTSFASNGYLTTDFNRGGDDVARDVTLLSNGQFVVAGTSGVDAFVLARYNANGALDLNFGTNGRVVYGAPDGSAGDVQVYATSDLGVLLVGRSYTIDTGSTSVIKFHSGGGLDTNFGTAGLINIGGVYGAIALQQDGKILAASSTSSAIDHWGGPSDFLLTRYHANGTRDTSFGDDGVVITPFVEGDSHADAVAVQANGAIVVGGRVQYNGPQPGMPVQEGEPDPYLPTDGQFALARYLSDGTLDSNFGVEGRVVTDFGSREDMIHHLTVLANGQIVADGSSGLAGSDALALARYDGIGHARQHLMVAGVDAGGAPHVKAFDANTGEQLFSFLAYDATFTGGVRVAAGDVDGDGIDDMITAAGPTGSPHIKAFSGFDGHLLGEFLAYDPAFAGGVYLAAGDVNGDGKADIITGADSGGGPHVKVFDGITGVELGGIMAFDPTFTGGVRVAAGDVNGDGLADIAVGAGQSGGPHARVFNAQDWSVIHDVMAYAPSFTGGIYVAIGDTNGDGYGELITGAGETGGPNVKVFDGTNGVQLQSYYAFDASYVGGVRVATIDRDDDGRREVIVAPGSGGGTRVRIYHSTDSTLVSEYVAYDTNFGGGTFVA